MAPGALQNGLLFFAQRNSDGAPEKFVSAPSNNWVPWPIAQSSGRCHTRGQRQNRFFDDDAKRPLGLAKSVQQTGSAPSAQLWAQRRPVTRFWTGWGSGPKVPTQRERPSPRLPRGIRRRRPPQNLGAQPSRKPPARLKPTSPADGTYHRGPCSAKRSSAKPEKSGLPRFGPRPHWHSAVGKSPKAVDVLQPPNRQKWRRTDQEGSKSDN